MRHSSQGGQGCGSSWQTVPGAWCLVPIDIGHSGSPARLADGNGWQTGDPSSEQDMGSPPCGAIDPAIDSARAEPSLDRTRQPSNQGNTIRKGLPGKQRPRSRHAIQQSKPLRAQTCLDRKPASRPSPKRSCEAQPIPAPVCEINVRLLKP